MNHPTAERGARSCPVCAKRMTLTKQGNTEIDVCEEHGVWLDVGELEAITRRMQRFGEGRARASVRRAVVQARNDGKVSGCLLGPLAFLFD